MTEIIGVAPAPTHAAILKPDHIRHVAFERVIVSHGEPVHDRAAFERALELPPWGVSRPDAD